MRLLLLKADDGNPINKKSVPSISHKQNTIKIGAINLQKIDLFFWGTLNCYVYIPLKENERLSLAEFIRYLTHLNSAKT